MLYVKDHLLAIVCVFASLSLFSQNIPTVIVDEQDPSSLSPVAREVVLARKQFGSFPSFQTLQLSSESLKAYRGRNADKIQVLNLNSQVIEKLFSARPEQVSLEIPMKSRESIHLDLVKSDVLADGFHVFTSDNAKTAYPYKKPLYYRGIVQGHEQHSIASISIFENQIIGSFNLGEGNFVIQPNSENPDQLIFFNDQDFVSDFPFTCYTDELQPVQKEASPRGIQAAGDCVRVYIECDYALYQNKGGTTNTVNWITAVFNNVKTLYTNENINTTVSEIFVWTTADSYSKTSSTTALNQFKSLRPTFNGDVAHLAALGGNNIGGVAWLDVLCSSYNYAYSNISSSYNTVPTYSWTVEVMTHEMGHNLGSNHTHWCGWTGGALDNCYTPEGGCSKGPAPTNGGTIMSYCHLTSYGINFNNGFGPQPGDKIRAEIVAATCLGTSCSGGGGCSAPTGLAISNITQTSATATWNSVSGANSYKFEYKTNSSGTWTVVTTSNTNYNMTGLTAGTLYNTRVKAVCSSGESNYSSTVNFTTTGGGGCGTPTNLAASNITSTTATVSWSAVSGASSYNFQYKLNSGTTWSQVNVPTTAVNMTGMSPATKYDVRVQAVCSGGNSAYTATLTFTTLAGYCASKGTSSSYEWVARVKLGTIDRVSGSDKGYFDATSLITDVTKGSSYTLNYQAGSTGSSGTLYWRIWIDFNNNNSFNDAGEQVVSVATSSLSLQSATISIPTGAATGTVRMRVSVRYGGWPTSCLNFPYGEVEDYSINIKAAGGLVNPGTAASGEITNMDVFPNPFNDFVHLEFNSTAEQMIDVELLDPLGRILFHDKRSASVGINHWEIHTDKIQAANYIVRIRSDRESHHKKLIKLD